jgi:hypothetical protein
LSRISLSRLTLLYFFFSVSHFIIQLALQVKAFTVNADAHHTISEIVLGAGTLNNSVPFLKGSHLHLCSWIPSNLNLNTDVASCPIVWNGSLVPDAIKNSMDSDLDRSTPSPLVVAQTSITSTPTARAIIATISHQPVIVLISANSTRPLDHDDGAYGVEQLGRGVCLICLITLILTQLVQAEGLSTWRSGQFF